MKILALACLVALLSVSSARAQTLGPITIDALNDEANFNVPTNWISMAFQVVGTYSGTITFRCNANGITYADVQVKSVGGTLSTTTTSTGIFTLPNAGFRQCQAKMTSYSSGGANITLTPGSGVNVQYPSNPVVTTISADTLCLSSTTKDSYFQEVGANNPGAYTGGTNCAGGTLRFDWNSTRVLFAVPGYFPDGAVGGPGISFGAEPTSGWYRAAAGDVRLSVLSAVRFAAGTSTTTINAPDGGGYLIVSNGNVMVNSGAFQIGNGGSGRVAISTTAPTIASGGCTSPTITPTNGTAAFLITIGTSCTGVKTITLTMPAASALWACGGNNNTSDAQQQTNYIVPRATSTTAVVLTSYDRVTGLQEDFNASDTYLMSCTGV